MDAIRVIAAVCDLIPRSFMMNPNKKIDPKHPVQKPKPGDKPAPKKDDAPGKKPGKPVNPQKR